MAATKEFFIWPARLKTDLFPTHRQNTPILFISVSPNNPTGAVASREQLSRWVDYGRKHEALLLFDAAYEAYISEPDVPHSIFEIPGARDCTIELRSFSKNGGFTGVRCGFTVMPNSVFARTENGRLLPLHSQLQP